MKKFILLYNGHATPPEKMSPEAAKKTMDDWAAWMQKIGEAMVDMGQPMRPDQAESVKDDGSKGTPSPLNGYSIIQADDLDAAVKMVDGHPFLAEGEGNFAVEVFELLPLPEM